MRKARILALFAATSFALALIFGLSACGRKKQDVDTRKAVRLNEVLTNEMSDTSVLEKMDRRIVSFMNEYQLKGLQMAVVRNDSLLYAKGYGWADEQKGEKMSPRNVMRLASVSKLITAIGIMTLCENDVISLDDKVLGPDGILCDEKFTSAIRDTALYDVTIEQLLRHEAGFSTALGDPMFSTRSIMKNNRLKEAPDHDTLVRIVLGRKLAYAPGKGHKYSNFGYLLLSMVIERVTGMRYEDWMLENVIEKAGCWGFSLANNYYEQRAPGEVRYYVPSNEPKVEEYNGSGRMVERCYGGNDIHALSGAGAWVGSIPELARLVCSVDGRPSIPDILSKESVERMTEYVDEDTYSLGWNDTDPEKGWQRTGSFSGTSASIMYYPDGELWIMVTNTSTWKGHLFSRYMRKLCTDLREKYDPVFPLQDLFYEKQAVPEKGKGKNKR